MQKDKDQNTQPSHLQALSTAMQPSIRAVPHTLVSTEYTCEPGHFLGRDRSASVFIRTEGLYGNKYLSLLVIVFTQNYHYFIFLQKKEKKKNPSAISYTLNCRTSIISGCLFVVG